MTTDNWQETIVWTIGHSTRTLGEFVQLLQESGIGILADIRTVPRSRHNPQFNTDSLPSALAPDGIDYVHIPQLGGLRRARPDSPNVAWRNASFRGYADHMQSPQFEDGLDELRGLTQWGRVALMCAEAVPWRCHRSLVADALVARGAGVSHILGSPGSSRSSPHRMTPFAVVLGGQVFYPATPAAGTQPQESGEAG